MRDTAFIICEYDPFHNGHLLHISETKGQGADNIICIMSGNFVQRGTPAFCDKFTRAGFAIEHGADLVLELPLKFTVSGAAYFAKGAVDVISATGLKGTLSFGAGAGTGQLRRLGELTENKEIKNEIAAYSLENGTNYALSINRIIEKYSPDLSELLKDPNNILAMEYMKAVACAGTDTDFYSVKRENRHDSEDISNGICSAKTIRESYYKSRSFHEVASCMPSDVVSVLNEQIEKGLCPVNGKAFSAACMARLVEITPERLTEINGVNQGLENRLLSCIRDKSDLYQLFDAVKTKRFTHSRIRQILLSAVLGINKQALERPQPYLRVLGMNENGRTLLRQIKENAPVPVVMNLSEAPLCEERALDALSGKLYDMCRPAPQEKNTEYASKPYVAS